MSKFTFNWHLSVSLIYLMKLSDSSPSPETMEISLSLEKEQKFFSSNLSLKSPRDFQQFCPNPVAVVMYRSSKIFTATLYFCMKQKEQLCSDLICHDSSNSREEKHLNVQNNHFLLSYCFLLFFPSPLPH